MREFKFRAWDDYKKKMFYHKLIYVPTDKLNDCFLDEDLEFMQYTGLKDKNNRDVYEGDIVKWNNNVICSINYNKAHFVLSSNKNKNYRELSWVYGDCEVVGNIYEHSKLLEDK